jgi:hypothetical protein
LRGGSDRPRHAKAAGEAYLYAAHTAARKPESVDDLHAALRLSRAVRDIELAGRALTGLLDFVDSQLQTPETGLGFAVQALEIAAAEPAPPQRVGGLAERISHAAQYVPLADRALKILLRRASEQDKPTIWRRRVELRRAEALASDHPAVKSARLQNVLQIAQESGQTDLRDLVAADLQACAKEDLGLISFTASSHQYEEAVADQIEAMIGADTWQGALIRFATFGPLTGTLEKNRVIVQDQHAASPLLRLLPTQLLGPDMLPTYTGITPRTGSRSTSYAGRPSSSDRGFRCWPGASTRSPPDTACRQRKTCMPS